MKLRKGEQYIVISHHGSRHPVGTLVTITMMVDPQNNIRPYYCEAVDGNTAYWYGADELAKEIDGIKV